MNMTNPAVKTAYIVVTNVLDTGTSFGVRMDETGDQVFIPRSIALAVQIQNGDVLKAIMVPNKLAQTEPDKAPWMAINCQRADTDLFDDVATPAPSVVSEPEPEPEPEPPLEDDIKDCLSAVPYATVKQIVAAIYDEPSDAAYNEAKACIQGMHYRGEVARIEVHEKMGQKRASYVYYTLNKRVLERK